MRLSKGLLQASFMIHIDYRYGVSDYLGNRLSKYRTASWQLFTWNKLSAKHYSSKGHLFRISRELQLQVCNRNMPVTSPYTTREVEQFYREQRGVGRALVNRVPGFSLAVSLQERRVNPSSCWVLLSSWSMRAPPSSFPTLFKWGFCLLIFYTM